jgi:hypothetical protein
MKKAMGVDKFAARSRIGCIRRLTRGCRSSVTRICYPTGLYATLAKVDVASSSLVTRSILDGATRAARKPSRDSNEVRLPCAPADDPRLVAALQPSATQKSSPFAPVKFLLKELIQHVQGPTRLRRRLSSSQSWVRRSQSGTSTTGLASSEERNWLFPSNLRLVRQSRERSRKTLGLRRGWQGI